jgi:microcystin-dependent protein
MIHEPRNIKDRVAVGDDIFIIEELDEGRVRLIPDPTHVLEVGTPIDKALLQPIENALGAITQKLSGIDEGANRIPPGLIAMWSGSAANVPSGWALCDGSNGTPDLRDRFIVGAGGSYNVGSTGGAAQVTLTVGQLPSHSHQGTISNAGAHTHTYYGNTYGMIAGMGGDNAIRYPGTNRQTSESGSHSHTFTIQATGGGQPHENRPPYYALAYIMKL